MGEITHIGEAYTVQNLSTALEYGLLVNKNILMSSWDHFKILSPLSPENCIPLYSFSSKRQWVLHELTAVQHRRVPVWVLLWTHRRATPSSPCVSLTLNSPPSATPQSPSVSLTLNSPPSATPPIPSVSLTLNSTPSAHRRLPMWVLIWTHRRQQHRRVPLWISLRCYNSTQWLSVMNDASL